MWETWVQSLGQEDLLEKEMATHSSVLAWKIRWTEEPGRLQSMGSQRVGHYWVTSLHFMMLGKIESRRRRGQQRMRWLGGITNLMGMSLSKLWNIVKDREVWHAEAHWVTKSWTWLSDWKTLMRKTSFFGVSSSRGLHRTVRFLQH